jgi:hypothetical protein
MSPAADRAELSIAAPAPPAAATGIVETKAGKFGLKTNLSEI